MSTRESKRRQLELELEELSLEHFEKGDKVVVLDNGSSYTTHPYLEKHYPSYAYEELVKENKVYTCEGYDRLGETGNKVIILSRDGKTYGLGVGSISFPNTNIFRKATEQDQEVEIKEGKWYKNTVLGGSLFCPTETTTDGRSCLTAFGFENGSWKGLKRTYFSQEGLEKATEEEVLMALVKEADKRGFNKDDITFIDADTKSRKVASELRFDELFVASDKEKFLYLTDGWGNVILNENGYWSQILDAHELPKIAGYHGEYDKRNGHIKYGCAVIPSVYFEVVDDATRHIKTMTLSSGVTISEKQMDDIRSFILSNK